MISSGVKTAESDKEVSKKYVADHLNIGISAMEEIIGQGRSVKHLKF
jgi:AMP nucleosidase